jgi:arylsulfatase A-like enzyme
MLLKGNHMYDPLVKVPLVIKWPGGRSAGTVCQRLVSNIDVASTLCRAAGLRPTAEMRGEDLGVNAPGRETIFCESGPKQVMVRTRQYKLLLTSGPRGEDLFFDLRKDPLELNNLYRSPEVRDQVKRLTAAAAAWRPQVLPGRFVDPEAPQIGGANVPPPGLGHRQAIMDYYRAKMEGPEKH